MNEIRVNLKQASAYSGISLPLLRQWIEKGILSFTLFSQNKLVDLNELDAILLVREECARDPMYHQFAWKNAWEKRKDEYIQRCILPTYTNTFYPKLSLYQGKRTLNKILGVYIPTQFRIISGDYCIKTPSDGFLLKIVKSGAIHLRYVEKDEFLDKFEHVLDLTMPEVSIEEEIFEYVLAHKEFQKRLEEFLLSITVKEGNTNINLVDEMLKEKD